MRAGHLHGFVNVLLQVLLVDRGRLGVELAAFALAVSTCGATYCVYTPGAAALASSTLDLAVSR
eukprot:CAMPEP_0182597996 /NCGR_PEP_ID=MMETSP1324-20130603/87388_1 /TAXON_ID=236786 /ORGANISM="Florenciella sp., Strain RCC1587" /LENGTH=63 /DNA_ID=CAMNT_0024815797 /DNA_START=20 /DNA_END=209 /DNA_ORIENTATION=+